MENYSTNERTKFNAFKNDPAYIALTDDLILMKISGENSWILINGNADTLIRVNPEGKEEIAEVNFYDMVGEPYDLKISNFKNGIAVVKFICEKNGKPIENFYELSQSGYTFNATKTRGESYSKNGIDYRYEKSPSTIVSKRPRDIQLINPKYIPSEQYLNMIYDIAQCTAIDKYNKSIAKPNSTSSHVIDKTFESTIEHIVNAYQSLKTAISKPKTALNPSQPLSDGE